MNSCPVSQFYAPGFLFGSTYEVRDRCRSIATAVLRRMSWDAANLSAIEHYTMVDHSNIIIVGDKDGLARRRESHWRLNWLDFYLFSWGMPVTELTLEEHVNLAIEGLKYPWLALSMYNSSLIYNLIGDALHQEVDFSIDRVRNKMLAFSILKELVIWIPTVQALAPFLYWGCGKDIFHGLNHRIPLSIWDLICYLAYYCGFSDTLLEWPTIIQSQFHGDATRAFETLGLIVVSESGCRLAKAIN